MWGAAECAFRAATSRHFSTTTRCRAEPALDHEVGGRVDGGADDPAVLGEDGGDVGVEHLEELRACAGIQGHGGKHVNHGRQYTQAVVICQDARMRVPALAARLTAVG